MSNLIDASLISESDFFIKYDYENMTKYLLNKYNEDKVIEFYKEKMNINNTTKMIAIEGVDYSGKTTYANKIEISNRIKVIEEGNFLKTKVKASFDVKNNNAHVKRMLLYSKLFSKDDYDKVYTIRSYISKIAYDRFIKNSNVTDLDIELLYIYFKLFNLKYIKYLEIDKETVAERYAKREKRDKLDITVLKNFERLNKIYKEIIEGLKSKKILIK